MEIEFGMPSKDCRHLGICRITMPFVMPEGSKQQCNCEHKSHGYIHQNRDGNLVFRFPKNQISPKIKATQFANDQFTVLEDYILLEPLQRLFCPRILIGKGIYAVIETAEYLLVEMWGKGVATD